MGTKISSNFIDCCGNQIISKNDLSMTSLSLGRKNNDHIVELLKKKPNGKIPRGFTKSPNEKLNNSLEHNQLVNSSTYCVSLSIDSNGNHPSKFLPNNDKHTHDIEVSQNILYRASTGYLSKIRGSHSKKISIDDFTFIQIIGRGSFGKVILAQKKDSGKVYALKSLKKTEIFSKNYIDKAWTEKIVMQASSSPFIVQLHYSFQSSSHLYFAMDYLPGGELFTHLRKQCKFPESTVRFYISEVILALEYLHDELNIIYRDLKPENILLDEKGHIKLTDFGLSKFSKGTSFCGTPEYLAPEILLGNEQGKAVDLWSLGCLIYEMLTGKPPFNSRCRKDLYHEILKNQPVIPTYFTDNIKNLLNKLLVSKPSSRLGYASIQDIKYHEFFSSVNWDDVFNKKTEPPIIPDIQSITDTGYFDKAFKCMPIGSIPRADEIMNKDMALSGFSYSSTRQDKDNDVVIS